MKIDDWSRNERDTLTGSIRTEFTIVTLDSLGDSRDFLEYVKAYDKDLDITKMKATYDRDVKAHDFWRGYSMEGILEVLDSIFLTDNKTAIECKDNVRLKTKISSDKINAGIQILRDHYGIFYKPEPKPLQQAESIMAEIFEFPEDSKEPIDPIDPSDIIIRVIVDKNFENPIFEAFSVMSQKPVPDYPLPKSRIKTIKHDDMIAIDELLIAYPLYVDYGEEETT